MLDFGQDMHDVWPVFKYGYLFWLAGQVFIENCSFYV